MTTIPTILANNPCDCPPGECAAGVEDEGCVNQLVGNVRSGWCENCQADTWWHEGRCLRAELHDETKANNSLGA